MGGLFSLPVCCLVWGNTVLGSMGSIVGLRTYEDLCQGAPLGPLLLVPPSPQQASANPHLHRRLSNNTSRWVCFSLPWGHFSFSLALDAQKNLFVPFPKVETLFPPLLWKSWNQIPLAFKVKFPGDSQSICCIPRLGSLTWGSEPSQQWENFIGVLILRILDHLPGRYGI